MCVCACEWRGCFGCEEGGWLSESDVLLLYRYWGIYNNVTAYSESRGKKEKVIVNAESYYYTDTNICTHARPHTHAHTHAHTEWMWVRRWNYWAVRLFEFRACLICISPKIWTRAFTAIQSGQFAVHRHAQTHTLTHTLIHTHTHTHGMAEYLANACELSEKWFVENPTVNGL